MNIIEDLKYQYRVGGIVNKLIYWNIALFAIPFVLMGILTMFNINFDLIRYFSLPSNFSVLIYKPWTLITYMFFHAGIFHILFNLIVLNFSARLFETYFTPKQLFGVFLLGGIFAGIIYLLSYQFFPYLSNSRSTLVGASGAIMAVLFATVTYNPMMHIRLFLFGSVKLWQIASVLIIMDLIQLPMNNTGGHLAHLGGALFGFIYIRTLQKGNDMSLIVTKTLDFFANIFNKKKTKTPFKKVHKNYNRTNTANRKENKIHSNIVIKDKNQQQIDDILDKISQSGYDSLTQDEKDFLFRSAKK